MRSTSVLLQGSLPERKAEKIILPVRLNSTGSHVSRVGDQPEVFAHNGIALHEFSDTKNPWTCFLSNTTFGYFSTRDE